MALIRQRENPFKLSLNGALRRGNRPQNAHIVVCSALFRPISACTASVDQDFEQVLRARGRPVVNGAIFNHQKDIDYLSRPGLA